MWPVAWRCKVGLSVAGNLECLQCLEKMLNDELWGEVSHQKQDRVICEDMGRFEGGVKGWKYGRTER